MDKILGEIFLEFEGKKRHVNLTKFQLTLLYTGCSYIFYPNEKNCDKFKEMVDLDICSTYQQCRLCIL